MSSLIWKEWHEQRWKLGFGCLVLAALAAIGLRSRILPDETMTMLVCFLGVVLLPILSSTGLIPAERADNTFESLLALPVAPWRILAAKTLIGLLLCAGPLILAAIAGVSVAGNREFEYWYMLILYARAIFTSIALFIWMLAFTARLPSETRAALLAMGLLVLWILGTIALSVPSLPELAITTSPLYFFFSSFEIGRPWLSGFLIQLTLLLLLWLWTARRFTPCTEKP